MRGHDIELNLAPNRRKQFGKIEFKEVLNELPKRVRREILLVHVDGVGSTTQPLVNSVIYNG